MARGRRLQWLWQARHGGRRFLREYADHPDGDFPNRYPHADPVWQPGRWEAEHRAEDNAQEHWYDGDYLCIYARHFCWGKWHGLLGVVEHLHGFVGGGSQLHSLCGFHAWEPGPEDGTSHHY